MINCMFLKVDPILGITNLLESLKKLVFLIENFLEIIV